jgi:hypothetical protein
MLLAIKKNKKITSPRTKMLKDTDDVIREIKQRSVAHKLEASAAKKSEQCLKFPATICAGILAALSLIQTIAPVSIILYANAAISCVVFILNGILSTLQTTDSIQKHETAARSYEQLYTRCVSEYFKKPDPQQLQEFIKQIEIDSCSVVLAAPLYSTKSERQAKEIVFAEHQIFSPRTVISSPLAAVNNNK